jgi:hypothetical protein
MSAFPDVYDVLDGAWMEKVIALWALLYLYIVCIRYRDSVCSSAQQQQQQLTIMELEK